MIPLSNMNKYGAFMLMTVNSERFEVTVLDDGYEVKDITPPTNQMYASKIHSIKPVRGLLATAKMEDIMFYDGIKKGYFFAWMKQGSQELMITKGKIESCTVKYSFEQPYI